MSTFYRVHSDRLEEELKNTTEEEVGINEILYCNYYLFINIILYIGNFIINLKEKLKIEIIKLNDETIEFDLIG